MERLTELHYKKSDGYYARCSEHCNDICDCNCEKWGEIVDRLGAYEDSGLEPEEIEKNKQDVEAGYLKVTARRYGIDVSRLRELVEADREGRLVMLDEPRKPLIWGDDNHDSILCPNCKHDLMGGFQEADSCEVPMYQCPYCGQPIDGTQALTHEEAETALKGENHEANPV